jgi:lipopolysaccharide/colanic/teichoic acid biosynthesis glycosyltransferase
MSSIPPTAVIRDYALKRPLDVLLAAVGIVVSAPLWVPMSIAIKLESPGPILHRAQRIGRGGRPFTLLKFRSMRIGQSGLAVTAGNDPRITRTGAILRSSKLDEIPQLINVLRGDMSLVGPRPEDPKYVAGYSESQRLILSVRPGMTGAAAVAYRHEETILAAAPDVERAYLNDVMPAKLALDLDYLSKRSLAVDIGLLVKTALAVIRPAD